jgi:hypothetical protein
MGSGFKTFTAGSILTASDVQNYLQDQAVMVFGGTAARSSAIGTANFEEGMLTYLTDVDKLQVYTGASFVDVYPAAATNQGLTLINTTSFSAVASQSINDVFSATYKNYLVQFVGTQSTAVGLTLRLRVSGADNTNSTYNNAGITYLSNNATTNIGAENATSFNLPTGFTRTGSYNFNFFEPFSTQYTSYVLDAVTSDGSATVEARRNISSGFFEATTSFTGFTLILASGTMSGDVRVYGYNV